MALITVVVPVYNTEKYLRRCVDSVLRQTYIDFELVLVDDGSYDECPAICDQYRKDDNRVQVIHQTNRGLSAARNAGIDWALTRGATQYITFVDSDDWVHPKYLELLYSAMQINPYGVAAGAFIKTNQEITFDVSTPAKITILPPDELYCNNVTNLTVAWGKLFNISDFTDLRFPEGKIHEDEFVTWKIMFRYDQISLVELPIYAYYQWTGSITNSPWKIEHLAALEAMEEQRIWFDRTDNERLKKRFRQKHATVYASCIRGMETIGTDVRTVRVYKRELKQCIRMAKQDLPFRKYYQVYRAAWPNCSRVLIRLLNIIHKAKTIISRE